MINWCISDNILKHSSVPPNQTFKSDTQFNQSKKLYFISIH